MIKITEYNQSKQHYGHKNLYQTILRKSARYSQDYYLACKNDDALYEL